MTNCRLLQPIDLCIIPRVFTVGHAVDSTGVYHDEGYHFHSRSNNDPPNVEDLHIGYAGNNYASVGQTFEISQDENDRGIIKADLTDIAPVSQAWIDFEIADLMTDFNLHPDPQHRYPVANSVGSLYGAPPLCDENVFAGVPYNSELNVVSFTPTQLDDIVDDFFAPSTFEFDFVAANIPYPYSWSFDITTFFNSKVGGLMGLRIEDSHAESETYDASTGQTACTLGTGFCERIVAHPGYFGNNYADQRGAITFTNFCLRAVY